MKLSIVNAGRTYVYGTLLAIDLVTPDRTMMKYGLLKTWVTVGIRVLLVISGVLVNWQTIDCLIRVNEILCRVGTAVGLIATSKATR